MKVINGIESTNKFHLPWSFGNIYELFEINTNMFQPRKNEK